MLRRPDHPLDAFAWMDVLRTVAAGLVAISHVRDMLWEDATPALAPLWKVFYLLTGFGHLGVVVFFVLSGFWITRSVMKRIDQPNFWSNYLIDRVSRLWVVLIPVLIIGGSLDWIGAYEWQTANYAAASGMHSLGTPVGQNLGLREALGSALFVANILVAPLGSNGPLWSLAYEFWYYLWFPALALLVLRRKWSASLVVLAMALFSGELLFGFLSWLMGSALHFVVHALRDMPRRRWESWTFAASFVVFLGLLGAGRLVQKLWMDPILAASFAVFLFGMYRSNLRFPALLRPVATFGSGSSFSLYALHFPLAMALVAWVSGGLRRQPSLLLLGQTMAIMALLFVAAFAFSRLTEAKTDTIRAMLKRMVIRPGPAAAAPEQA